MSGHGGNFNARNLGKNCFKCWYSGAALFNASEKISSSHPEIDSFDSYNELEETILTNSIYADNE